MKLLIYILFLLTIHRCNAMTPNNYDHFGSLDKSDDSISDEIDNVNLNHKLKHEIRNPNESLNEEQLLSIDSLDYLINEGLTKILKNPLSKNDSLINKITFFNTRIASDDKKLTILSFEDYSFRQFTYYNNFLQYKNPDSNILVFKIKSDNIPQNIYNVYQNIYIFEFSGRTCSSCLFSKLVSYEIDRDSGLIENKIFSNKQSHIHLSYRLSDNTFLPLFVFDKKSKEIHLSYRLFYFDTEGKKIFDDEAERNIFNQYVDNKGIVNLTLTFDNGLYEIKK